MQIPVSILSHHETLRLLPISEDGCGTVAVTLVMSHPEAWNHDDMADAEDLLWRLIATSLPDLVSSTRTDNIASGYSSATATASVPVPGSDATISFDFSLVPAQSQLTAVTTASDFSAPSHRTQPALRARPVGTALEELHVQFPPAALPAEAAAEAADTLLAAAICPN